MKKGRKAVAAVAVVVIVLVFIYNAMWFYNYNKYMSYTDGYEKYVKTYNKTHNYNYTIKVPDYFFWKGSFEISTEDNNLSVRVYPKIFMQTPFRYQVSVVDEESGDTKSFYIDKHMQIDSSESSNLTEEEMAEVFTNNGEELSLMLQAMQEEWEF